MITFRQYIREQDDLQGKPLGDIGANQSPNEILQHICNLAIENHQDELLNFFDQLAEKDEKIKEELDNFKKGNPGGSLPPGLGDDGKDTVVPAGADGMSGIEED
jgi:hypothetical protein